MLTRSVCTISTRLLMQKLQHYFFESNIKMAEFFHKIRLLVQFQIEATALSGFFISNKRIHQWTDTQPHSLISPAFNEGSKGSNWTILIFKAILQVADAGIFHLVCHFVWAQLLWLISLRVRDVLISCNHSCSDGDRIRSWHLKRAVSLSVMLLGI